MSSHDLCDVVSEQLVGDVVAVGVEADGQESLSYGGITDGRRVLSTCNNDRWKRAQGRSYVCVTEPQAQSVRLRPRCMEQDGDPHARKEVALTEQDGTTCGLLEDITLLPHST